jgi:hypothetical protein
MSNCGEASGAGAQQALYVTGFNAHGQLSLQSIRKVEADSDTVAKKPGQPSGKTLEAYEDVHSFNSLVQADNVDVLHASWSQTICTRVTAPSFDRFLIINSTH